MIFNVNVDASIFIQLQIGLEIVSYSKLDNFKCILMKKIFDGLWFYP